MYISKICLKRIKCFEDIEIDLNSDFEPRKWCVILGDNGVGKTTLLRCIAMGLCEASSFTSLMSELYGDLIRRKEPDAVIKIEFKSDNNINDPTYFIETTIKRTSSGYNEISQKTYPEPFPWDNVFVCGYGAARRAYGTRDYDEYGTTEAVLTLFNYDIQLQNPELILRRMKDHKNIKLERILNWFDNILMLPEGSVQLGMGGITISGPWGKDMPLGATGDGYQSTLTWVADFLGWLFFFESTLPANIKGMILIDEIEQHLHPKWQRAIIKLLKEQFPTVQFIVTTHAPLCVVGTTDLKDDECRIIILEQIKEGIVSEYVGAPPRGKRVDQILTSYLFGLDTSSDNKTKEEIGRYYTLISKENRTENDKEEIIRLRNILTLKLGTEETELEQVVRKGIVHYLEQNPVISKLEPHIVNFEIKRQLKELLEF